MPGRKRVMRGRRRARQAQMMPISASIEDQIAAEALSYVGSGELEMATSCGRRRTDTMQTLRIEG